MMSDFYTGLVADLYSPLRGEPVDPEPYARFVREQGTPALELGCGDGDPLLALRMQGLDVEGLDSSPDMLARCRARAVAAQVDVVLHESAMQEMQLPRHYRSMYIAGPTFNLLPDDETAGLALSSMYNHLEEGGTVLIPLFVPTPVPAEYLGRPRVARAPDGSTIQVTTTSVARDEDARVQRATLRYERIRADMHEVLERMWLLHWYTREGFEHLVSQSGLGIERVSERKATQWEFILRR